MAEEKEIKYNLTPAERQRRSELAKELHGKRDPITGRQLFGGPQPGSGRPRKKRVTESLNEHIEQHADEIFESMLKALRSNKPFVSLQAAKQMVEVSQMEMVHQAREERQLEDTPTEELVEIVASRLARLAESGAIPYDIEGTAYTEDGPTEEISEGNGAEVGPEDADSISETDGGDRKAPFTRRPAD